MCTSWCCTASEKSLDSVPGAADLLPITFMEDRMAYHLFRPLPAMGSLGVVLIVLGSPAEHSKMFNCADCYEYTSSMTGDVHTFDTTVPGYTKCALGALECNLGPGGTNPSGCHTDGAHVKFCHVFHCKCA